MKLNLPNKLTLLRIVMSPLFMFFIVFEVLGPLWSRLVAVALFSLAAITDMLDGKIARKYNLITDLGKFLDPMADKLMIFFAMLAILLRFALDGDTVFCSVFIWVACIVILRELMVISLRLVAASKSGLVIAAANLGKIKTVTQIVAVIATLLEPVLLSLILPEPWASMHILGYITCGVMAFFTLWSGLDYLKAYWKVLA